MPGPPKLAYPGPGSASSLARRPGVVQEEQGVVDDTSVARTELDGRHGPVRIGRDRDYEAAIEIASVRGDWEGLGNLEHQVGRTELPPFGEFRRRRQVLRVTLRRPGLGPVGDPADLLLRQPTLVVERAKIRLGLPRGHPPASRHLGQETRSLRRIAVCQERERPDLARPMAARTLLPKDGSDIPVVGRSRRPNRPRCDQDQRVHSYSQAVHQQNSPDPCISPDSTRPLDTYLTRETPESFSIHGLRVRNAAGSPFSSVVAAAAQPDQPKSVTFISQFDLMNVHFLRIFSHEIGPCPDLAKSGKWVVYILDKGFSSP